MKYTQQFCKHQCHQTQPPGQWRPFVTSYLEEQLSSVGGDRYISALAFFWNRPTDFLCLVQPAGTWIAVLRHAPIV